MSLVLDGGFSNELQKYCSFNVHQQVLWSAHSLQDEQEAIIATHRAYVKAGCDVIETSTFQASISGFNKQWNLNDKDGVNLIAKSVELARIAIQQVKEETGFVRESLLIAGSVGPYGATLCDGSEYSGNYMDTVQQDQLIDLHLPRIRGLVEGKANVLLVETIPSLKEAEVVLELVKKHFPNTEVWISFSIKADNPLLTPRGESMKQAFETVTKYSQVTGFGINCCTPRDIQPFLDAIEPLKKSLLEKDGKDVRLIVYPNSGDDWVRGEGWIKKDIPTLDTYATQWMDSGASVIGGCCQVGPDDILKLRKVVDEWNAVSEKS